MTRHGSHARRPAIVMIPGDFGDAFDAWGACCAGIGPRGRTVTLDRPAIDAAPRSNDRLTVAAEADNLLEQLDAFGLPSFHLAGHSYGALIALAMAASVPHRVRSLHLVEPPLLSLLQDQEDVQAMARRAKAIQAAYAEAGDEATTEAFFAMIGAAHVPARLRGTDEWSRMCQHAARFARAESAADVGSEVLERLSPGIPVSIYSGGRSDPALRAIAEEMSRRLPDAPHIEVANAGHAVQMAGEAFIEPFLGRVAEGDAVWERRALAKETEGAREEGALR